MDVSRIIHLIQTKHCTRCRRLFTFPYLPSYLSTSNTKITVPFIMWRGLKTGKSSPKLTRTPF